MWSGAGLPLNLSSLHVGLDTISAFVYLPWKRSVNIANDGT